jgi:hypothetical protein
MRSGYGIAKAVAFCLLALALGLQGLWAGTSKAALANGVWVTAVVVSWIATAICLVRGIPVLWEARTLLKDLDAQVAQQADQR